MQSASARKSFCSEIEDGMKALGQKFFNGSDHIPAFAIYGNRLVLLRALHKTFNLASSTSSFLVSLEAPVHKDGDHAIIDNYWPIFVLSNFTKVFKMSMCAKIFALS